MLLRVVVPQPRAAVPVHGKQEKRAISSGVLERWAAARGTGNTPYNADKVRRLGGSGLLAMEDSAIRIQGLHTGSREACRNPLGTARRWSGMRPDLPARVRGNAGGFRFLKRIARAHGGSEGDPRKIAGVILQLAKFSDEVPVRLILGVDAEKRVQQAEARCASEQCNGDILTVFNSF